MIIAIVLIIVLLFLFLIILTSLGIYTIYKDQKGAAERFHIQMEMAKAQSSMTNPLKFEDCRTIINNIINFYCIMENVTHGYYKKTPSEFSLEMDKVILQIALESRTSLSPELVRQFGKFATIEGDDSYLDTYILHTTRIVLMDEVNRRRVSANTKEPLVPKTVQKTETKKSKT